MILLTKRIGGKKPYKVSRQNLLLSATLNEKVNHLANISLLSPITIGLDDKKISSDLPNPSIRKFSAIESDEDEKSKRLDTLPGHSESYNLLTQLIQHYAKGSSLLSVNIFLVSCVVINTCSICILLLYNYSICLLI